MGSMRARAGRTEEAAARPFGLPAPGAARRPRRGAPPGMPLDALPPAPAAQQVEWAMGAQRTLGNRATAEVLGAQARLAVGKPGDAPEVEADRIADRVMRAAEPVLVWGSPSAALRSAPNPPAAARNGASAQAADSVVQREAAPLVPAARGGAEPAGFAGEALTRRILATRGGGSPLPAPTRGFMERRFGADFAGVRIHTGDDAAQMSRDLDARAFTVGSDIYFDAGGFSPDTADGRRILAHELAHTLQQTEGPHALRIQRVGICNLLALPSQDTDYFCTPFTDPADIAEAQHWMKDVYLPWDGRVFGASSRMLYEKFLNRKKGDSLTPEVFDTAGNDVVESFATSGDTKDDEDAVLDLIGARLSRVVLPDDTDTTYPITAFLSAAEMESRDIDYSNPLSIAGHIAGGVGSSDAGKDYRKIEWGNVQLRKTTLFGNTGYVSAEVFLHYEVGDAVDFCPGDWGSGFEACITVPMSRLEATGVAYDVPFVVKFLAESRSKRFWF